MSFQYRPFCQSSVWWKINVILHWLNEDSLREAVITTRPEGTRREKFITRAPRVLVLWSYLSQRR